jgi:hypothetical protein
MLTLTTSSTVATVRHNTVMSGMLRSTFFNIAEVGITVALPHHFSKFEIVFFLFSFPSLGLLQGSQCILHLMNWPTITKIWE